MIIFKEISKEELKKDYSDRRGFVFQSQSPCSDSSVELLAQVIISNKVTSEYPEFVIKFSEMEFLFVYQNYFDMPLFFHKSNIPCQMAKVRVDTYYNYINN